jgi:hypothetical protein
VREAVGLHFLDVGTRGEGLVASGQHEAALRGVRIIGREHGDEVGQHLAVQRVQHLRPVEPHQGDGIMPLGQQRFVGHRLISL